MNTATIKNKAKSFMHALKASRQTIARSTGVALLALALLVQAFSAIMPTQAEAASYSPAQDDMIANGVKTKAEVLAHYDANTNNFRDVMNYAGITRAELANMTSTKKTYTVSSSSHSWGWRSHFGYARGERAHSVAGRTIYSRPQALWGYKTYTGWEGHSAAFGSFRIMAACANLVGDYVPAPKPKPVATCDALKAEKVDRNHVKLSASASVKNGASISQIHYLMFDASGKTVNAAQANGSSNSVTMLIPGSGTYKVQAFAISSLGNVTSANCAINVTATEEQKPSIAITKTVNKQEHLKVAIGTEFTYEITVANTGKVDLKDAVVTDKAPTEISLVKGSEGTINGNTWTHTIPTLKAGESKSYTITAKYAKYSTGTHKNMVCVDTPTIPGGPDACDDATTETYENLEVCDLKDNTIKTISRSQYDESHMTTDKSKCGDIKVCVIKDKSIKTIAKKDFDEQTMTTDLTKCSEQPVTPPTTSVTELPKTGLDALSGILGVSGLIGVSYAYLLSRRNLG